jgi:hypothetical protein
MGFFLHSRQAGEPQQSSGFSPPGPPGGSGRSSAIPPTLASGLSGRTVPEGLGTARFS